MNWPLFWVLLLAFGIIIGNIMLVKHSANMKIPNLKDLSEPFPKQTGNDKDKSAATEISHKTHTDVNETPAQKPNSPE